MGERLYRTQILLEPGQHQELSELARRKGQSVSNVVREAVARYLEYEAEQAAKQKDVIEEIRELRAKILADNDGKPLEIDIVQQLEEMREERDNDLLNSILGRD